MLLRQMRYFVSVVKLDSFTKAAEENFISQSAISQQIRALEEELGAKLFSREGRKFTVTRAGELFYKKSLLVLDEVQRTCRETARIANGGENELSVGCARNYAGREIQAATATFSCAHPGITLHILYGNHEELYDLLCSGDADMVINEQRRVFSQEYVNLHLADRPTFIEVASHSLLANLRNVTAEELRELPCILVSSKAQRETEQEYYRDYYGFAGDYLFAESLDVARLMAASNRGFLPVEGGTPGSGSQGFGLKRVPLLKEGQPLTRNYCAFWSKANHNPNLQAFADKLIRAFQ